MSANTFSFVNFYLYHTGGRFYGKEAIQGGEPPPAGSDDQLHLHPQGDLPAGDPVQRQRRRGQAGLPGPDRRQRGDEPGRLQDRHHRRQDRPHPDRQRQRHRHDQGRAGRQPGHHLQVRLPPVQGGAGVRRFEGRGHRRDRPVRRGLLLRLHGGRRGHRRSPRPSAATPPTSGSSTGLDGYTITECDKAGGGHRRHPAHQAGHRGRAATRSIWRSTASSSW